VQKPSSTPQHKAHPRVSRDLFLVVNEILRQVVNGAEGSAFEAEGSGLEAGGSHLEAGSL